MEVRLRYAYYITCQEVIKDENGKDTLYRLADSMYVFWYRFVRPNISSISRGVGEQIYEAVVIPQLNDIPALPAHRFLDNSA